MIFKTLEDILNYSQDGGDVVAWSKDGDDIECLDTIEAAAVKLAEYETKPRLNAGRLSEKILGYAQEIDGYTLAIDVVQASRDVAGLEEALAEYENDETARRRADAFKIRTQAQTIRDCHDRYAELAVRFQDR